MLDELGFVSWRQAFIATLDVPHNSMKLLRDEFDVFFANGRRGWLHRDPHPSRLRILSEFEAVSDDALLDIVRRILAKDQDVIQEILPLVSSPPSRVANVAERLLTGRRAEEHFMRTCLEIIEVPTTALVDLRHTACGYDFRADPLPGVAIEIKGLKSMRGGILFTEREWSEARDRRENYWVVVVGNLAAEPLARVFPDPVKVFDATCQVVKSASTVWTAEASVA